jgi:hypothetical protein
MSIEDYHPYLSFEDFESWATTHDFIYGGVYSTYPHFYILRYTDGAVNLHVSIRESPPSKREVIEIVVWSAN